MSEHPPEQDDALSAEDGDADESPRPGSVGSKSGGIDDPEARFDHELIRRAQRGEEDAFSELVRRHEARAWRIARNLVGNNEDARDVAQEAFLRVFKSLDKFDFRHEFTTWLYRIVSNLGIDHLRRRRKHVSTAGVGADDEEYELDLPDEDGARPDERLDAIEASDGTLLDHTVLLLGGSQISSHSGSSFPLLLAGGNKLGFRHGQHLRWKANTRSASDLYLTILQQLRCPVESFKESRGPISELLA